jgi:two-component system, NtrC family, C4-dicarboxylate transport sensor histidine kinase DctB
MIFTVDDAGTVLSVNPYGARQLGYTVNELEGRSILEVFHEEDRPAVTRQLELCMQDPTRFYHWQLRKFRRDGTLVWVEEVAQAVHDLNGALNVLIVCQDITERKRAEEALRESEQKYRALSETLEQRVKETVAELRDKDRMLIIQGRQAVMGEMISNISHQWRQPLNILGLLAQELQATYKKGAFSGEFVDANVGKTMEIIKHMSKTIDDFRNFFKSEKEKVVFEVLGVVEKTMSLLEGSLTAVGIVSEIKATGNPSIDGYPNEFAQVLLNIVNNARDAFLAGKAATPTITIRVYSEAGKTVVTISDNAGGVPEAIIDNIFEPYFTTKGPDKGTGIGLYMSKTIIEKNMGGSLSVRNVGPGAEFRIVI